VPITRSADLKSDKGSIYSLDRTLCRHNNLI
jgi:hypothetical protein